MKKNISDDLRLNHLLTMSAGLEFRDTWDYDYKGLWKMYEISNFTVYALSRRKIHEPGEVFEYSDMTVYMLGVVLDENTGMKSWEFADSVLFRPLGITEYKSEVSISEDIIMANYGLRLKAEDFAKFAWMIAQNGEWEEKRIVSENWIWEATTSQIFQIRPGIWKNGDSRFILSR